MSHNTTVIKLTAGGSYELLPVAEKLTDALNRLLKSQFGIQTPAPLVLLVTDYQVIRAADWLWARSQAGQPGISEKAHDSLQAFRQASKDRREELAAQIVANATNAGLVMNSGGRFQFGPDLIETYDMEHDLPLELADFVLRTPSGRRFTDEKIAEFIIETYARVLIVVTDVSSTIPGDTINLVPRGYRPLPAGVGSGFDVYADGYTADQIVTTIVKELRSSSWFPVLAPTTHR